MRVGDGDLLGADMQGDHQIGLVGKGKWKYEWFQAALALLQKVSKEPSHLSSLALVLETGSRSELTCKELFYSGCMVVTCHQPPTSHSSWAAKAHLEGSKVQPATEERVEGIGMLWTEGN